MKNHTYFSTIPAHGETGGKYKALWAYRNSVCRNLDELELSEFLWKTEVKDFLDTLKKAGIKSFVVTDHSTGLMEMLHQLQANGCTLEGLCTITRSETPYEDAQNVNGIRFTLD